MAPVWDWLQAVIGSMDAAEWQAVGTVGTFVVAVVAAFYAAAQVKEARRTRGEQTRPYVAAFLELGSEVEVTMLFLVVKNFGTTTARDITVTTDRPMKRAWGHVEAPEDMPMFSKLHSLVPGQEWRTLFDWGPARFQAGGDLDVPYTLTVASHDSAGRPLPEETFVIDWAVYKPTKNIGVKTVHDVGKSLQKIERTLSSWTEGIRGLSVVVRDGDKKDEELREELIERGLIDPDPEPPVDGNSNPQGDDPDAVASASAAPVVHEMRTMDQTAANHQLAGLQQDLPSYPDAEEDPKASPEDPKD